MVRLPSSRRPLTPVADFGFRISDFGFQSAIRNLQTAILALGLLALAGCSRDSQNAGDRSGSGKSVLQMWHAQKEQNKVALEAIVERFNATSPNYEVRLQNMGTYKAMFEATRARIQGGNLPDLCIVYESMVAEFMQASVVLPLDDYLNHPDYGLGKADQADIFPSFLQSNRYAEFNDQLLSFPFTKSVLMLYCNTDLLRSAGIEKPPETWGEFIEQCRKVKAKTGRPAFAYSRDASSFDGMVLAHGGKLATIADRRSHLDGPEAVRALEVLAALAREELLTVIALGTDDDRRLFAKGDVAFILRSSTTRSYMEDDLRDADGRDKFQWLMAPPPVGEGRPKLTVLYGGNILIFRSTPERQRGAWEFIKFFISPEVTAEWSVKTGYLPVRRSAAEVPLLKDFFAKGPRHRAAFEAIPLGVPEPNVAGWQAVRDHITEALTNVTRGAATPAQAAAGLGKKADAELARFAPSGRK
ncbi:MAG: ABC transporter substrate-binding protein [Planctomycetes bacterium]|nr:ABC transporter substrate-binding protein [Planctomycetota bacterium]